MKQGGNEDDAPGCPPHPGFVRGLCFLCGAEEEETEGGAPGPVGREGGDDDGDGVGNDDPSRVTVGAMSEMKQGGNEDGVPPLCPPHPYFVRGFCLLCGAEEETEGGAPGPVGHEGGDGDGDGEGEGSNDPSRVTVANIDGDLLLLASAAYMPEAAPLPDRAVTTSIAGASDLATLFRERKLVLILDLDHTLINSTELDELSFMERLNGFTPDTISDPRKELYRLHFDGRDPMLIKLRPFVRGFLEQANTMFELHVYTLGAQDYARAVVKLLDPNGVYFGDRVVSRAETTIPGTKSLDVVARAEVVAVVIVDDTDKVWPEHQDNLILMDRYHYFASACTRFGYEISSMAEAERDEREHDGSLAVVLGVLKRVHQGFFDGHRDDVREVISEVRRQLLAGCTVAFSYLEDSMEDMPEATSMWKVAERLGAVCKKDVDETVTHVVAEDPGSQKAQWARDHGKFLVNPEWIKAASFRWVRQDEQQFPVTLASLLCRLNVSELLTLRSNLIAKNRY